jgi:hypothetical protein
MNSPRPLYRIGVLLWISFCRVGLCVGRSSVRVAFLSPTSLDRAGHTRRVDSGESNLSRLHNQLIPQENPNANLESISKSGVRYQSVLAGLHRLIPPDELEQRNAVSRTDGYWPFVRTGEEPPLQLTYGEFDFYFFAELLDRAWEHYCDSSKDKDVSSSSHPEKRVWKDQVFIDVGSGAGRLVLAAAALHPAGWKQCRGVELLPGLHKAACENLDECRLGDDSLALPVGHDDGNGNASDGKANPAKALRLAPIDFVCASFEDNAIDSHWKDASCIFVTASCLPSELLQSLRRVVGQHCRLGTIVMSTDYPLPLQGGISGDGDDGSSLQRLELLEKVDGYSWVTGGDSTAYIHRVVAS